MTLDSYDIFGFGLASLGDLDGDGVGDLAVGAIRDDDEGRDRGAVWILFLDQDGTVKSHEKISSTQGGFIGTLDDFDTFGQGIADLGVLGGDGICALSVGAGQDGAGKRGGEPLSHRETASHRLREPHHSRRIGGTSYVFADERPSTGVMSSPTGEPVAGTHVAALFYSLIESAKLCRIEPRAYLREATLRAVRNPSTATLARDLKSPRSLEKSAVDRLPAKRR